MCNCVCVCVSYMHMDMDYGRSCWSTCNLMLMLPIWPWYRRGLLLSLWGRCNLRQMQVPMLLVACRLSLSFIVHLRFSLHLHCNVRRRLQFAINCNVLFCSWWKIGLHGANMKFLVPAQYRSSVHIATALQNSPAYHRQSMQTEHSGSGQTPKQTSRTDPAALDRSSSIHYRSDNTRTRSLCLSCSRLFDRMLDARCRKIPIPTVSKSIGLAVFVDAKA